MPDMYGFLHESCTGRYENWAVSSYVWGCISISFRGNCTANENNQDRNRRRRILTWRRDCSFQTWEDICKQNKICRITLHMHEWWGSRSKTCTDPAGWLWPYRWENACWACICKLRWECRCSEIHSTCREGKGPWKNSDPWMYRSRDRKSCSWSM